MLQRYCHSRQCGIHYRTTLTELTAITGGIGCGKSVVAEILRMLGHDVYDCDSRAKFLMDSSRSIKEKIAAEICEEAILPSGCIDRATLAEKVFADNAKLENLNTIVHEAVRLDIQRWAKEHPKAFIETAILYQSQIDRMVDHVWEVTAPRRIRVERVMLRSALTSEQVIARINSQESFVAPRIHPDVSIIENDGVKPVLPQILHLLARY